MDGKEESEVTGINRRRNEVRGWDQVGEEKQELKKNDLILYTPEWNRSTLTDRRWCRGDRAGRYGFSGPRE